VGWKNATVGVLRPPQLSARADRILHAHYTGTRSLPAGAFQLRYFHRQPALMQGMYAGLARRIFE
jgi:hypothetical protein